MSTVTCVVSGTSVSNIFSGISSIVSEEAFCMGVRFESLDSWSVSFFLFVLDLAYNLWVKYVIFLPSVLVFRGTSVVLRMSLSYMNLSMLYYMSMETLQVTMWVRLCHGVSPICVCPYWCIDCILIVLMYWCNCEQVCPCVRYCLDLWLIVCGIYAIFSSLHGNECGSECELLQ